MEDTIKIIKTNDVLKSPLKTDKGTLEIFTPENLYLIPANWGGKSVVVKTGLKAEHLPDDVFVGVEPVGENKNRLSFLPSWENNELVLTVVNVTDKTILIMSDSPLGVLKGFKVIDVNVAEEAKAQKPKRTKSNAEVK